MTNFNVAPDPGETPECFARRLSELQQMSDGLDVQYTNDYTGPHLAEVAWWECANCGKRHVHHIDQHFCETKHHEPVFKRRTAEFVGMLRIKNEGRWIGEVIESILPLCSEIFVMDDHSTDDTVKILRRYPQVRVYHSPFTTFNESRDKNWLYDQITAAVDAKWILAIDGDEVLELKGPAIIRETIAANPDQVAFKLKIAFLWNDPGTVRVDRIYDFFYRPSLFQPFNPGHRFLTTPFGRKNGNLHCSSVPQRLVHEAHVGQLCHARLKHYGYIDRTDRVRKLDWYNSIDWKNAAEDMYRHMCQGDNPTLDELPLVRELLAAGEITQSDVQYMLDVPPHARLVHAGPIELRPYVE